MADGRREAAGLVGAVSVGAARKALRDFVRGRDDDAWAVLARADPHLVAARRDHEGFADAVLEALEYRVAPSLDDDEPDGVRTELLPLGDDDAAEEDVTQLFARDPASPEG